MKRILRPLLLTAALASLLCVIAFAYTYYAPVNGTASISNYSTQKFDVTATKDVTSGEQYLVLVMNEKGTPTEDNIVYINQEQAENSKVTFSNVYPSAMAKSSSRTSTDNIYYVYVVGEGRAFDAAKPSATFKYYDANVLRGDANSDGNVRVGDATLVLRYCAELIGENDLNLVAVDVNGDGKVRVGDAALILRYCAELITEFPN